MKGVGDERWKEKKQRQRQGLASPSPQKVGSEQLNIKAGLYRLSWSMHTCLLCIYNIGRAKVKAF